VQTNGDMNALRFTFYGGSVSWKHLTTADRGIAEVTLDGGVLVDEDTYGTGGTKARTLSGLAPGIHTLTIGNSGRKNAASTGYFIDAMEVTVGR